MYEPISSDRYLQFTPRDKNRIERLAETKGKYNQPSNIGVAFITILDRLKKAIKIVENTEEYTEYLLFETFGDKKSYTKIPPGTIRVYGKTLICFFNGRTWRQLK